MMCIKLLVKFTCVRNIFPWVENEFFTGFSMAEKRDFTCRAGGRFHHSSRVRKVTCSFADCPTQADDHKVHPCHFPVKSLLARWLQVCTCSVRLSSEVFVLNNLL